MVIHKEKERSLFHSLLVDFVLSLPDVVAAILANSIIMLADVLKCATELISTFLAWIAIRKISRGSKAYYDYGFGKLENLTGIIVAGIMFICFAIVAISAILRIRTPESVHAGGAGLGGVLMFIGMWGTRPFWVKILRV